MHVVVVLFAVRHGKGSEISEYSLSLMSSRCGWLQYEKTMVTIYGSSIRGRGEAQKASGISKPRFGKRTDESAGPFFAYRWEGCVTKGISMTFMERGKDGALKMIIVTDAKYPI